MDLIVVFPSSTDATTYTLSFRANEASTKVPFVISTIPSNCNVIALFNILRCKIDRFKSFISYCQMIMDQIEFFQEMHDFEQQREENLRRLKQELGEWMAAEYYAPHQAS